MSRSRGRDGDRLNDQSNSNPNSNRGGGNSSGRPAPPAGNGRGRGGGAQWGRGDQPRQGGDGQYYGGGGGRGNRGGGASRGGGEHRGGGTSRGGYGHGGGGQYGQNVQSGPSNNNEVIPQMAEPASLVDMIQNLSLATNPDSVLGAMYLPPARATARERREKYDIAETREPNAKKQGDKGTKILLTANFFKVELRKQKQFAIYQYRLDFNPSLDDTRLKKKIIAIHHRAVPFGFYIFDGTVMYTLAKFRDDLTNITTKHPTTEERVDITIRYIRIVTNSEVAMLQVLGILLRKIMETQNLSLIGRNYYDCREAMLVPIPQLQHHRLRIASGFVTSIRQHETDILMCVDTSSRVLRDETALDVIRRVRGDHASALAELIGQIVLTKYNNKSYRIDDIDWNKNPRDRFETSRQGEIQYTEYYRTQYQLEIRDQTQPLLVFRSTDRERRAGVGALIYLIPEFCYLTGIPDAVRNNTRDMRVVADATLVQPTQRVQRYRSFGRNLQSTECTTALQDFGVGFGQELVQLEGRVLPSVTLQLRDKGNKVVDLPPKADLTRSMISSKLYEAAKIVKWAVVYPRVVDYRIQGYVSDLTKAVEGMGITFTDPEYVPIERNYTEALMKAKNIDPQIILVVMDGNNAALYSEVKKFSCCHHPVLTQVVTIQRVKNTERQIAVHTKVGLQMSVKMGCAPWHLKVEAPPLTMIVGFDVYHDTKNRNKSYGAMVSTLDNTYARVYSATAEHNSGQELSNSVSMLMLGALQQYRIANKRLPARIIFYRDGVGDGQLKYLTEIELVAVREKLAAMYEPVKKQAVEQATQKAGGTLSDDDRKKIEAANSPKFMFIVVTKRINTRLFVQAQNAFNNVPAGTVVDTVITQPERKDFYLVPQDTNRGTATPCCYNIIYDTIRVDINTIQALTYRLCYMYFNWAGPIRVPFVCQCAHKLAFLVGSYLHIRPTAQNNRLFYL